MEFATPVGMFYAEDNLSLDTNSKILRIVSDKNENNFQYGDMSVCTDDDLHLRSEFKNLLDFINAKTEEFTETVLGIKFKDFKISGMWSNVHNSGSKHHSHQHPNSFLSGVFYPFCPSDCEDIGNIIFTDPRQAKNMFYADFFKTSCISNRTIWITPKTGLLLIFPSWLEHSTDPFICKTNQKRVSISFNFRLVSCNFKTMKIND
jgi:uncharacterized protein (TIGR02466 family)